MVSKGLTGLRKEHVKEHIHHLKQPGHISESLSEVLTRHKARTARFYLLPKINKKGIPGRSIICGDNCPTECISSFIDEILKPYVPQIKSYVKDSAEFVKMIDQLEAFMGNCLWLTMYVTSLYTNMLNCEGLRPIKWSC